MNCIFNWMYEVSLRLNAWVKKRARRRQAARNFTKANEILVTAIAEEHKRRKKAAQDFRSSLH